MCFFFFLVIGRRTIGDTFLMLEVGDTLTVKSLSQELTSKSADIELQLMTYTEITLYRTNMLYM